MGRRHRLDRTLTPGTPFSSTPPLTPDTKGHGIGAALVDAAAEEVRAAGCEWLHVDFEPHLERFYLDKCRFGATRAGLMRLTVGGG